MVTEFLERRAIIEENYGRELMKLAKNTKEKYSIKNDTKKG